jgi:hypothetical protein
MSVAIQTFLMLVFFGAGVYLGYRVGLEGGFLNFIEKGISRRKNVRRNHVIRSDVIRSKEWEEER